MRVLKNPTHLIEQLGDWARPKTPEGQRAADIVAFVLIIAAAMALLFTLR